MLTILIYSATREIKSQYLDQFFKLQYLSSFMG